MATELPVINLYNTKYYECIILCVADPAGILSLNVLLITGGRASSVSILMFKLFLVQPSGDTALHFAVAAGQHAAVEELVKRGADPLTYNKVRACPTTEACEWSSQYFMYAYANSVIRFFDVVLSAERSESYGYWTGVSTSPKCAVPWR